MPLPNRQKGRTRRVGLPHYRKGDKMRSLVVWAAVVLFAPLAVAGPMEDYCSVSAAKRDITQEACVEAEKDAEKDIAASQVDKALLAYCESIVGESRVLVRLCIKKESERAASGK